MADFNNSCPLAIVRKNRGLENNDRGVLYLEFTICIKSQLISPSFIGIVQPNIPPVRQFTRGIWHDSLSILSQSILGKQNLVIINKDNELVCLRGLFSTMTDI